MNKTKIDTSAVIVLEDGRTTTFSAFNVGDLLRWLVRESELCERYAVKVEEIKSITIITG